MVGTTPLGFMSRYHFWSLPPKAPPTSVRSYFRPHSSAAHSTFMTLIELARPQIFMALLSPAISIPILPCRRRSAAAALVLGLSPGCGDTPSNRTCESSIQTGLGRRNESGPAPAQAGIVDTSSTVGGSAVMSMTLRSTPDIRLDSRATAWRPDGDSTGGGGDPCRATVALRDQVGHAVFVEPDSSRRSSACVGHQAANRCTRNRSASQAGSIVAVGDLQCPVLLQLELQDGPSRKARVGERRPARPLQPVGRLARLCASCNTAGSRSSVFEPHSKPFVGIAVRVLRSAPWRRRGNATGQRQRGPGRSIDISWS